MAVGEYVDFFCLKSRLAAKGHKQHKNTGKSFMLLALFVAKRV
jgi:hypothetical protein